MKYVMTLNVGVLIVALAFSGCSKPNETKPGATDSKSPPKASSAHDHSHGSGPNGGVVFDLGSNHAEFTVNHDKQECTVLILAGDGKTSNAVAAAELTLNIKETKTKEEEVVPAMTITLLPSDTKDGKASKFVGTDPGIGKVADFEGTVSGEIDGKPAMGEFKE